MSTRWEGRERMRRRFQKLPQLAKLHVRKAMEQGAREITDMQRRLAPRDDGPLQEAIHWAWRVSSTALMTIAIRAWSPRVKYAHLVEYGTRPHKQGGRFAGTMHPGTKPQPFFWPSYRALKRRVMNRIRRGLRKAVAETKNA